LLRAQPPQEGTPVEGLVGIDGDRARQHDLGERSVMDLA
jgi:hypothetical protein